MAVPFRRTSKTKKRMRRSHFKLAIEGVAVCAKCGAMVKTHHVCAKCGYYDGKLVLDVEGKKAQVTEEKKAKKAPKAKKEKAVKEEKAPKAKKAPKVKKEEVEVKE